MAKFDPDRSAAVALEPATHALIKVNTLKQLFMR
jgi:hypothetical protein